LASRPTAPPAALVAAGTSVLVLLACAGWQATRLASQAPPPVSDRVRTGMDAGTALPPPDEPPGIELGRSAAIATRQLSPGMVSMEGALDVPVPQCQPPRTAVVATDACFEGAPYPACRWRMPEPAEAGHAHVRWRNTRPEHWWGRPSLVSIVLAVAQGYAQRYPGEQVVVGDLDAAGSRHVTHDRGVDVDLYLPGVMEADNAGGGAHPSNYVDRPRLSTRMRRARVHTLAQLLASCTGGALRIYYNDPPVAEPFLHWFRTAGFVSPFGKAMQAHNALHRFHFHVTIAESLGPVPGVTPTPQRSGRP
jgi:hypothetical protein